MAVDTHNRSIPNSIRVGIIGCGRMGAVHAKLLGDMGNVVVQRVADSDLQRASGLAASIPGATAFGSAQEMLEDGALDAVHILTPPPTHKHLSCAAMAAGCHVFVEKPMAVSRQEAMQMLAAANEHGRLLTVDHNNRFDPVIARAQKSIAAGKIGRLVSVEVFHSSLPPEAPWVSRLPSGDWFNDFDHLLYLSECFLGDVRSVKAIGTAGADGRIAELHVGACNERGWSGLTYSTETSPFEIRLVLRGSNGVMEIDLIPAIMIERHTNSYHRWVRKGVMNLDAARQLITQTGINTLRVLGGREKGWGGLRVLLESYYAAIRNGGGSPVAMDSCLRIVELKEEIIRQLES